MGNGKTNRFAFVFYPESVSFDTIFGLLRANHTRAMISPIHDKDTWSADDCYERYRDLFRTDPEGFISLNIITYTVTPDGEQKYYTDDWKVIKNKKELTFSDLVTVVTTEGTKEKRVFGSKREFDYALPDFPWADANLHVRFLFMATFTAKNGEVIELPFPGSTKKEHYHVLVKFDYSLTVQNALNKLGISDYISYMQQINSEAGYIRYLCHLDDSDKATYSEGDVVTLGGYSTDPLYYQGAIDQEIANDDLYTLANTIKRNGGGFSEMLESVQCMDWKQRKAFRSNQSMWRNYLYKTTEQPK